jgi:CxxC motif-containing protein
MLLTYTCHVGREMKVTESAVDCKQKKGILTTLVRIKGTGELNVVPVKSSAPIDKSLWIECSKALSRLYVGVPIKIGDVVCKNILNTGVDIVCTRNVGRGL